MAVRGQEANGFMLLVYGVTLLVVVWQACRARPSAAPTFGSQILGRHSI